MATVYVLSLMLLVTATITEASREKNGGHSLESGSNSTVSNDVSVYYK